MAMFADVFWIEDPLPTPGEWVPVITPLHVAPLRVTDAGSVAYGAAVRELNRHHAESLPREIAKRIARR